MDSTEDYAFVAGGIDGLQVFGVANPVSHPTLGAFGLPDYTFSGTVVANYAFLSYYTYIYESHGGYSTSGAYIVDISDPSNPHTVRWLNLSTAAEFAVVGQYAYAADGNRIHIIDCEDPAHADIIGSFDVPGYAVTWRPPGTSPI